MTATTSAAVVFLLAALPPNTEIPETELADAAARRGITPQTLAAARRTLRACTSSGPGGIRVSLNYGPCVACATPSPYPDPTGSRESLCPGCESPIRVWTWTQPTSDGKRRKETVTVAHRPGGWPGSGRRRQKACNSVFDRARAKTEFCAADVVWRVETKRGHMIYTAWWCDDDLPTRHRPTEQQALDVTAGRAGS